MIDAVQALALPLSAVVGDDVNGSQVDLKCTPVLRMQLQELGEDYADNSSVKHHEDVVPRCSAQHLGEPAGDAMNECLTRLATGIREQIGAALPEAVIHRIADGDFLSRPSFPVAEIHLVECGDRNWPLRVSNDQRSRVT